MRRPLIFAVLGYVGTLALLAGVGFFITNGLEGRVERVEVRQHRDHRHIIAIERGHPLGGDALQPAQAGQPSAPGQPGGGHQGETPTGPKHPPSPNPPPGHAPEAEPPPTEEVPATESEPSRPEAEIAQPGLVESTLDTAGSTICSVAERLLGACP